MMPHTKRISFAYLNLSILIYFCFVFGCASTNLLKNQSHIPKHRAALSATKRSPLNETERKRLLEAAQKALGRRSLTVGKKSYRGDCSGTIRAIFTQAKIGLGGILKKNGDNDVKTIYRYVQKYGRIKKNHPLPGDLVFFHNTYDRNKKGQMDNALTHIGIVEQVQGSTVHFIHHLGQLIIRSRMDLSLPHDTYHPKTGLRINHVLRRAHGGQRAFTCAELFAGFGHL